MGLKEVKLRYDRYESPHELSPMHEEIWAHETYYFQQRGALLYRLVNELFDYDRSKI
jgi:hypothetical protein